VEELRDDKVHGAAFFGRRALALLSEAAQASDAMDADSLFSHLLFTASKLRRVQPAMANVWNLTGELLFLVDQRRASKASVGELRGIVLNSIRQLSDKGNEDSEEVARNSVRLLPQDGVVLTHSYSSTVFRSLELGFKSGRRFTVYATESYPGMEGKQLAKDLIAQGVPVTLIADSAVTSVIEKVSLVLVGADSVLRDGSLAHKAGTREIGMVAKKHEVPLYSSSETMKFSVQDFIGERPEISTTLFDVTPQELVSSYITEEGELAPSRVELRIRDLQKEVYP
jgi:translation initiation factor 2B subunit (eIF-2B alpha/beta/delta family)